MKLKNLSSRKFKKKFTILLPIILLIVIVVVGVIFYNNQKSQNCYNPFEVKDLTSDKKGAVQICNDSLYHGSIKVVNKEEFNDLFEFTLNEESDPEDVEQYVRVFERDGNQYVSMVSEIDYTSWNNSSIGIYRKVEDEYKKIFKKTFDDNQGRWVNIEFGEDRTSRDSYFYLSQSGEGLSISGDIGTLGCLGACRMLWWDYYEWDSEEGTYVLANNKHPEAFESLLEDYKDFNNNKCLAEADVDETIASLYPARKDKEKLCSDNAEVPYTTPEQAEMLLKGIKAIEMIIDGENISMSQVKNVEID